jgi:hypothetical protein
MGYNRTAMTTDTSLALHLRRLEESLLGAGGRDSDMAAELLADEFLEFGSSGRPYTKAQTIAALGAEGPVSIEAHNIRVRLLAPETALVTYRAVRHSEPPVHSLRSSIWQLQGKNWRVIFHQGTRIPEP